MGTIISYDNSVILTGFAVMNSEKVMQTCGVVNCKRHAKVKNLATRIDYVTTDILTATLPYFDWESRDTTILFEMPVVGANAGGALKQAMILGALCKTVIQIGVTYDYIPEIHLLNNMKWKAAVGKGNMSKEAYWVIAKQLYPSFDMTTDDVAASVLMAIAYLDGCPTQG